MTRPDDVTNADLTDADLSDAAEHSPTESSPPVPDAAVPAGPAGPGAPARTRFAEPASTEPEPAAVAPVSAEPVADEPAAAESAPAEPAAAEPAAEPAAVQSSPAAVEPAAPADPVSLLKHQDATSTEPDAHPVAATAAPTASDESAPRGGFPAAVVAGLAVLVLALAAITGVLTLRATDDSDAQLAASRKDGLAAARTAARVVLSYDYRRLEQDFAAGRVLTTGAFRGEYDRTTTRLVEDAAPRYKAVVVSDVSNAAVISATENRLEALVFVNQQSSSSLITTPKITQSRLVMTLVKKDGRWLVEKIKAL